MPTPKPNEKESDFVTRCIPIVIEEGTAKDDEQAAAICHSMFKQDKKKNSMNPFQFSATAKKAEILLYGPIGRDFSGEGISAKDFADQLVSLGDLSEINIRINSPGGSAFDGLAIYNMLNRHGANVVIDVDGLAASAASVIAMAGDEIHMAENALMMIHNAAGVSMGTAKDMEKTATILRVLDTQLATTYAQRSGTNIIDIAALMEAGTFFNAKEAMQKGLATHITEAKKIAAYFDTSKFSWLNNMPCGLLPIANTVCGDDETPHTIIQRPQILRVSFAE